MSKLTDEDGIDGPFERAMARIPRPRCACGRARRKAAAKCQRCLDADHAAVLAAEPKTRWAREWRRLGFLCAIFDGAAHLVERVNGDIGDRMYVLPIDGGRWSRVTELADWTETATTSRLHAIARDCYCSSFPDAGCDFCNGTRLPDGAGS
jgi:hypothetical protein